MHYQVNEIFHSIQGEGLRTGIPSTFIRLQGCPVGCEWCDTKYTWFKGGERMTVEEIVEQVRYPSVIITGGEPILYNLDSLINALLLLRNPVVAPIQLETSGLNDLKGMERPGWITVSPKHRLDYKVPDTLCLKAAEFKFVVDENLTEEIVEEFEQWKRPIVLMPEGTPPRKEMMDLTMEWLDRHPTWRYSDRLQYRLGVR